MKRDSKTTPSWSIKHLKSPVDAIDIRYAVRKVKNPEIRILFLNGRNEWIEKYEGLPEDTKFGEKATWVMMDHRGQGASGGQRAHVKTYDHFVADAAAVVAKTFGGKPYLIVAHSMGGLIAMTGTLKGKLHPTQLVLSSPLFGLLTPMPLFFARILAQVLALTPIGKIATGAGADRRAQFEGNPLTHSADRFNVLVSTRYKAATPTFAWVHATFKATAILFDDRYLKRLKIPVTVMVGGKELVVDKAVFEPWFAKWKSLTGIKGKFKVIPGANHELLNEDERFRKKALALLNQAIKK